MIASPPMQRGNMIPEMALVLSIVMMMLFGIMQYALIGFDQIGADGAAFVGDHAAVAYYSSPTTANGSYAQQVGKSNFPQTGNATYTASIPKNGAYEMDLNATTPIFGTIANLFPSTVSSRSRIIEPSQSTAGMNTPVGQCANAAESLTANGTTILNNTAVDLLGNVPTDTLYNVVNVNGVAHLELNETVLSNLPGVLTAESSAFQNTVTQLNSIANTLALINKVLPGVGTSLGTTISTQVSPLLASATGGAYTTTGIVLQAPLSATQFANQQLAASNAITTIESANAGPLLAPLFSTLNTLLGSSTTTGLLNGPGGSLLATLNNAENAVYSLNSAVKPCTTF